MIDLSNKLAWNSETRNEFWRIGLEFMACCFFGNCFASFYLNISDTDGWVWALRHGPIHNSSQTGLICLGLWLCLTGTVITQMFGLTVSNESESAAESIWKRFLAFLFFFFFFADSLHLTGSWPHGGTWNEMRATKFAIRSLLWGTICPNSFDANGGFGCQIEMQFGRLAL